MISFPISQSGAFHRLPFAFPGPFLTQRVVSQLQKVSSEQGATLREAKGIVGR